MKKTIVSFVTAALLSSTTYAQDTVLATVNGDKITNADVAVLLKNPKINFQDLTKVQQEQILENLVEQKLLSQEAMKSGITKTAEYKSELAKLKQTLAFQIWMRDLGKTIKVSDKELQEFYNNNKAKYKAPLQLKASHILLENEKDANKIIATLKKAKDTKATFTQLAKDKSVGPTGSKGGELGWFTQEKMVPAFSQAAAELKVKNFTTTPVKTQFGYHVIYLDDKKESQIVPLEKIKNNVQQQALQDKFVKAVKKKAVQLKKNANIQYK